MSAWRQQMSAQFRRTAGMYSDPSTAPIVVDARRFVLCVVAPLLAFGTALCGLLARRAGTSAGVVAAATGIAILLGGFATGMYALRCMIAAQSPLKLVGVPPAAIHGTWRCDPEIERAILVAAEPYDCDPATENATRAALARYVACDWRVDALAGEWVCLGPTPHEDGSAAS